MKKLILALFLLLVVFTYLLTKSQHREQIESDLTAIATKALSKAPEAANVKIEFNHLTGTLTGTVTSDAEEDKLLELVQRDLPAGRVVSQLDKTAGKIKQAAGLRTVKDVPKVNIALNDTPTRKLTAPDFDIDKKGQPKAAGPSSAGGVTRSSTENTGTAATPPDRPGPTRVVSQPRTPVTPKPKSGKPVARVVQRPPVIKPAISKVPAVTRPPTPTSDNSASKTAQNPEQVVTVKQVPPTRNPTAVTRPKVQAVANPTVSVGSSPRVITTPPKTVAPKTGSASPRSVSKTISPSVKSPAVKPVAPANKVISANSTPPKVTTGPLPKISPRNPAAASKPHVIRPVPPTPGKTGTATARTAKPATSATPKTSVAKVHKTPARVITGKPPAAPVDSTEKTAQPASTKAPIPNIITPPAVSKISTTKAVPDSVNRIKATSKAPSLKERLRNTPVYFEAGNATVQITELWKIRLAAGLLKQTGNNRKVEVIGFTDSKGSDAGHPNLGRERALAVVNRMAEMGIDAGLLSAQVRDDEGNTSLLGGKALRRVELHLKD